MIARIVLSRCDQMINNPFDNPNWDQTREN